jgi:hypothetical protein
MMSSSLMPTLEFAVMLRISEIHRAGYIGDRLLKEAINTAELIAHEGDTLLYGGEPGKAGEIFNKLAIAIAVLSFQPGGFCGLGMKFISEFAP